MRWIRSHLWLTMILCLVAAPAALAQSASKQQEGVMVGRISDIEGGQVLRYVPEEKDWVVTVKDTPFGLDDAIYTEQDARAEVIMPNGTRMRIGGETQVQLVGLQEDVTQVDVASGTARIYNDNGSSVVKVTTPFGYVVADAGATFDVLVSDQSAEAIALKGKVDFIRENDRTRYSATAGSGSLIADRQQVSEGDAQGDIAWDNWNLNRDETWSKRTQVQGDSVKYLPEEMRDEAYELEANGRWESVNYEGEEHYLWRPTRVSEDWQPYTEGRWTVYHEDNTWVPDEPFGYVTHHYGNWVWVDANNAWYWAPPTVSVGVGINFSYGCHYCWHPGRVGWIYSNVAIGWFPLAPFEPYYAHRWWGPGSIIVANINLNRFHGNINRFRFVNRAVVINQHNLYRVNNYRSVRLANINRNTIARNFRAAPMVSNRIVRNAADLRNRHAFSKVTARGKPNATALSRIQRNQKLARQAARVTPNSIERSVASARPGKLARGTEVSRLRSPARGIDRNRVHTSRVGPEGSTATAGKRAVGKASGKAASERQTLRGQRSVEKRALSSTDRSTKPGGKMRTAKPERSKKASVNSRSARTQHEQSRNAKIGRTSKAAPKVAKQPKRMTREKRAGSLGTTRAQRHGPASVTESRRATRERHPAGIGSAKSQRQGMSSRAERGRTTRGRQPESFGSARTQRHGPSSLRDSGRMSRGRPAESLSPTGRQRHGPSSVTQPQRTTRGRQPESFGSTRPQRHGPSSLREPGRMSHGRQPESLGSTGRQRQAPSSLSERGPATRGRQPESFGSSRSQRQRPASLSEPGRMNRGRQPEAFGSTKPQRQSPAPAAESRKAARGRPTQP